jgi:hypothetical protein
MVEAACFSESVPAVSHGSSLQRGIYLLESVGVTEMALVRALPASSAADAVRQADGIDDANFILVMCERRDSPSQRERWIRERIQHGGL